MENLIKFELREIFVPDNEKNGKLTFLHFDDFEFMSIKRMYSIYGATKTSVRGHHAHKRLKQLLFCSYGKIKITIHDGRNSEVIILDHPSKILFIGPMIWHTMEWLVDDSVLVVLASEKYDESDYIRNYDELLSIVANEKNSI